MGTNPPLPKRAQPPIFSPCLLWPKGWMDQAATCYRGRSRQRHIVLDRAQLPPPERGTAAPLFWRMSVVAKWSPISATAELLLQSSSQSVPILYNGPPLPPSKLPLLMGRSGPSSNTRFLELTRANNPNGISINSAVFAGFTTVTDRPRYSVCNNKSPHHRGTVHWEYLM